MIQCKGKILRKFNAKFQKDSSIKNSEPESESDFFADENSRSGIESVKKILPSKEEDATENLDSDLEALHDLEKAKERYAGFDRDHVWAFVSGHSGQDFRGNPKYLFVYINRYRTDIAAYWLCSDEDTILQVRKLGFTAHKLETPAAQYAIDHTGVLVEEQVKVLLPQGLENVKYLNLWHGVGFKHIERKQLFSDISLDLAQKYIHNGTFYRDHQLLVVTSPDIEEEYVQDCGVDDDKLVRTGYLRCLYQKNFDPVCSFDHDLRGKKNLTKSTRMVVYAPTTRPKLGGTFAQAIPDFEALYDCCVRNDILLIFKVHPQMEKEVGFLIAKETYGDRQRFWFWDNRDDFYEIMDQIDLAIYDYSSIFSDFVAAGVPHYIRYIFDADSYLNDDITIGGADNYFNQTIGQLSYSFEELLNTIDGYWKRNDAAEFKQIYDKLWSYTGGKDDFEKTISQVMNFQVKERDFPTLYSFDIFDTLISRKVLEPEGIFALVRDRMEENGGFPREVVLKYPEIRLSAEKNVREYYRKTQEHRGSSRVEISFAEIIDRIANVYCLSKEQADLLAQWEIEEELNNVIPLTRQIDLVKKLKDQGETVVLICDMYLPKEIIEKMLCKADPILAELPLFLSSDYGVQKTSKGLFFEVYKSFEPYYDFKKWIHYGDTIKSDITSARKFEICARKVQKPHFNEIQQSLVHDICTGDSYLVAALQARMCAETSVEKDEFVISYIALTMVPYVDWVIRDAQKRGYRTLYFISRDGYHLKRIADEIIRVRGLDFQMKYIYASRRTWRIPSYIDEVDDDFWLSDGNFADLTSKGKMLKAMDLDEETFRQFFPTINPDTIDFENKNTFKSICEIFRNSNAYNEYLLERAAQERPLVEQYLKQEICFDEPYAFVEYYGRGYNQECLLRLLDDITGDKLKLPFYYMRTILPSMEEAIRYHFTTNATAPYFMESIFANMPYKSIEEYRQEEDGTIVPVINPLEYDRALFESMSRILPEFAAKYAALNLRDPEATDRLLHDFAFNYYKENLENSVFTENIGPLKDSVSLYGTKREFAPPFKEDDVELFANKKSSRRDMKLTTSITMSLARSSEEVRNKYFELYQILPGDDVSCGRLLSENEQQSNREYKQKFENLLSEAEIYKREYDLAVQSSSVQNKAVIVLTGKSYGTSGLDLVETALRDHGDLNIETFSIKRLKDFPEKIATKLATAKYVIVFNPVAQFCEIHFRPETEEIMLDNQAFSLNHRGMSANYFLKWRTNYSRLVSRNDISVLQVPSYQVEDRYRHEFSPNYFADCSLRGCCNTDIYFQKKAAENARKQIQELFPEAEKKKIVLYMPTVRWRKSCNEWLSILNLGVLKELIGEEYVVVVNFNANQLKERYFNTIEIPGFSKMINKGNILRQLMLAADVIVGDYRDTFYESALLHKPVYFTVSDCEEVMKNENFALANEIEKCIFGPVIATAQDLADQLARIESYDYSMMEQFRESMLADCDGHSVDRVVNYLADHMA